MSLNINGERLLAEALADAMNRDLEEIPTQAQLEEQHHFSKSFERNMRKLEKQAADEPEQPQKISRFSNWRIRRYGAWAAAFVCVIGLAAVAASGGLFRMGAAGQATSEDSGADGEVYMESAADETADTADSATPDMVLPEDEMYDDAADADQASEESLTDKRATAPDWQEQLLAESAKADQWVSWSYERMCDDGSIILGTTASETLAEDSGRQELTVSGIYEVYYEQSDGEWTRVYHTSDRQTELLQSGTEEEQWYALSDLNMTQSGTYRLVRQVGPYRQVLQLTVEEKP